MSLLPSLLAIVFTANGLQTRPAAVNPTWVRGPYLMLDDRLMVERDGVVREINHPSRWPDPIVTGYEDGCFQPWVTVVRDPQTKRFRMWYNVPASPGNAGE
ncbi:MAG TPA: hypothetical protein PLC79_00120, partial [Phycisphaerae bacterium]|nr:hypothetical protein [Phycisphaerae bacterium]